VVGLRVEVVSRGAKLGGARWSGIVGRGSGTARIGWHS
jgi:hypothetical protein